MKQHSTSYSWVYTLALVLSVGLIVLGAVQATHGVWSVLAAGCGVLAAVMITWPIACHLHSINDANNDRAERALTSITERFEQFSIMLNLISEQQLLSDRAKAVAFREKDSDALRRAIQDEMHKQNWELAMSLANEMEESFGYRKEADRLRTEIQSHHDGATRKHITDTIGVIDRHIRAEIWPDAMEEAHRLARLYPNDHQAATLPQEVEKRRVEHKQQLVAAWNDSVARHDVDGAIEILKRLDAYLTPTEAEAFQENARSIFKEKLGQLRTQFATAVQDHQWAAAIKIGDMVISDFPNTQMAHEVREMMPTLRLRANGIEPVSV